MAAPVDPQCLGTSPRLPVPRSENIQLVPENVYFYVSATEVSFSVPAATMTPLEPPQGALSNLFTPSLPLPRPPATHTGFSPERIWVFLVWSEVQTSEKEH